MRLAIIGGGVTGLAAGLASGAPVYEQSDHSGGICRSYYLRPGQAAPSMRGPVEDDAYRFEVGGGHWIFGGDPAVLSLLGELVPMRSYERDAVVRVRDVTVPYPLQDHVEMLGAEVAGAVAGEQDGSARAELSGGLTSELTGQTLGEWLEREFGQTLCRLFFHPFNDRYAAGLASSVAAQDGFKSPHPLGSRRPAGAAAPARGYNATFSYPVGGLDRLVDTIASSCDVHYGKRLVAIDVPERVIAFDDGTEEGFEDLLCTLPLSETMRLAGVEVGDPPDPFTSVLVLNIGATRGPACPDAHWQYECDSPAGFHRIGFYSNVDESFLPVARRGAGTHVSMYVERAYAPDAPPSEEDVGVFADDVVKELQGRGYIGEVEVLDPSWVRVAYTWRLPGSNWREDAIAVLAEHRIHQIGRYGAWHFQGIADSIRDGLSAGRAFGAVRPAGAFSV